MKKNDEIPLHVFLSYVGEKGLESLFYSGLLSVSVIILLMKGIKK